MPLVRITMPEGLAPDRRAALAEGVHRALVEVAKAPADDRFQILEVGPKALYAALAESVTAAAPVRREDVIVNLVEVPRENWSFGGGVMSYPPAP